MDWYNWRLPYIERFYVIIADEIENFRHLYYLVTREIYSDEIFYIY